MLINEVESPQAKSLDAYVRPRNTVIALSLVEVLAQVTIVLIANRADEGRYWSKAFVEYQFDESIVDILCLSGARFFVIALTFVSLNRLTSSLFRTLVNFLHAGTGAFAVVKSIVLFGSGVHTYVLLPSQAVVASCILEFFLCLIQGMHLNSIGGKMNAERKGYNTVKDDDAVEEEKPRHKVSLFRVATLAEPEKWLLLGATVALLGSSFSTLAIPAYFGRVINSVSTEKSEDLLVKEILSLGIVFVLGSAFTFVRGWLFTLSGQRLVARLRKSLFKAISQQEIGFFDTNRTGELTNRLASDTQVLQQAVTVNISMVLRNVVNVIGGVIILFFVSWELTLVMLSVVPVIALAAVSYGRSLRELRKKFQDALAEASTTAEETLSQIRTVRSFARESNEQARYGKAVDDSYEIGKKTALFYGAFAGGASLAGEAAMLLVLWYGGSLVIDGHMSPGVLTSFLLYTITIAVAMGTLASLYGEFMQAVGASERLFELMDRVPDIQEVDGMIIENFQGRVELKDLTFSYPSRPEIDVLTNVNMTLEPGKILALVGPSGGGKSTVISIMERFYDPRLGRVLVDGEDLKTVNLTWLRHQIGLVSQEPVLFATTIRENIAYGCDTVSEDAIVQAAQQANAHSFISEFTEGYDALVGERGVRLSGGQKQRIAIARALLMDPKILLLDEATSALDAESEFLVQEAIDRLMVGRTVLVIAHRLSTVRDADLVCVIDGGKVVERGTHDELLALQGVYMKLVKRQMFEADEPSNAPTIVAPLSAI